MQKIHYIVKLLKSLLITRNKEYSCESINESRAPSLQATDRALVDSIRWNMQKFQYLKRV